MPELPVQLALVVNSDHAGHEVSEMVPVAHQTTRARREERVHGTARRCTPTMSRSKTAARATEKTRPTMMGVLNPMVKP